MIETLVCAECRHPSSMTHDGKRWCETYGCLERVEIRTGGSDTSRLYAAAPDMLEALEAIMLEFGPGTMSDEAFGKAVAAISKAKGETT